MAWRTLGDSTGSGDTMFRRIRRDPNSASLSMGSQSGSKASFPCWRAFPRHGSLRWAEAESLSPCWPASSQYRKRTTFPCGACSKCRVGPFGLRAAAPPGDASSWPGGDGSPSGRSASPPRKACRGPCDIDSDNKRVNGGPYVHQSRIWHWKSRLVVVWSTYGHRFCY